MRETVKQNYEGLAKLGMRPVTRSLLAQLDRRMAAGTAPQSPHFLRANLLRRCGDLQEARAAFIDHLRESAVEGASLELDPATIVPSAGLQTGPDHLIAPLMVIDDFLPPDEMAALHRHACELEASFVDARTMSEDVVYNPDKRRTLVTMKFEYKRQFFLDFVESNLARFQSALGLPDFEVERIEIKLTNHVDGGFFKIHSDNHSPISEAGRVFTWLYYFSEVPPRFEGGDLFVIDSKVGSPERSRHWFSKVEALPNRLVAFPSCYFHAVGPTSVTDSEFRAGRFAVSSHVRKRADNCELAGA